MLKFKDLSMAQKACVIAFLEFDPSLSCGEITNSNMIRIFKALVEGRKTGGPVVGEPLWLSKHNNLRRGVQMFPVPSEDDLVYYAKAKEDNKRVERIKTEKVEKAKTAKRTPKVATLVDVKPVKAVKAVSPEVVKQRKSLQDIIPESTAYDDMGDDDFSAILEANGIYF